MSIEQFAVGGFDTVRGYRENQIVRDVGAAGSVELHLPLVRGNGGESVALELIPFVDVGFGRNVEAPHGSERLASVGVGLQWTPNRHVNAQLFYGHAIEDLNDEHNDLQDYGIHFSVLLLAF